MIRYLGPILLLLVVAHHSQAQVDDSYYSYEADVGINFNTNGGIIGGISTKFSRNISNDQLCTFSVDIVEVKHLKEQRATTFTGQVFVFGKENYLYSIRPQYGREFVLFNKYPEDGIRLSAHFSAGPSIGLEKPYYIEYQGDSINDIRIEAFDPEIHDVTRIRNGGFFLRGIGETNIVLGVNARAAVNFEFSRNEYIGDGHRQIKLPQTISGIEAGFTFEAYARKVPILSFASNRNVFTAAFITLYYGRRW